MAVYTYLYSGLRVASDLSLPEWSVFAQAQPFDDPDVLIRVGPHSSAEHPFVLSPVEYCFQVPDIATYWVRAGSQISVLPAFGAGEREIRLFLLGSAWGALCYQRGLLPLHASVVQVGDHATAFCGSTGSGKSSLAAWLMARGYGLVSDDLCRLDLLPEGPASVHPAAMRLKLWRDALEELGHNTAGLERDYFRTDKFHADLTVTPLPLAAPNKTPLPATLPLRGIYLLEWGELGIIRLMGADALHRFVASATYRGDLLEPMGRVAAHWEQCANVIRRVPIWSFSRPRDWARMATAMEALAAHLSLH